MSDNNRAGQLAADDLDLLDSGCVWLVSALATSSVVVPSGRLTMACSHDMGTFIVLLPSVSG